MLDECVHGRLAACTTALRRRFPSLATLARKQFVAFLAIREPLRLRVSFQFLDNLANSAGNIQRVTHRGAALADLDIRVGCLATFDTIRKVLKVRIVFGAFNHAREIERSDRLFVSEIFPQAAASRCG